jgi:hypothetical protein
MYSLRSVLPYLLIVLVSASLLVPNSDHPFHGDDSYVLRNLDSPDLGRKFAAWTAEHPGPSSGAYTPWFFGYDYRRQFVRLVPSALASVEATFFGRNPIPYHLVTILLHMVSCMLLFRMLLRLGLDRRAGGLAAVLFAAHPAAAEICLALMTQPIVTAGLCVLITGHLLLNYLEGPSRKGLLGMCLATLATLCTYESVVLMPVFIVAVDVYTEKRTAVSRVGGWPLRTAMLACLATYMVGRHLWGAEDFTLASSFPRDLVLPTLSGDLADYWTRAFGIASDSLHEYLVARARTAVTVMVWLPVSLAALWILFRRKQHLALLGLTWFFAFIAPPVLVRATLSILSLPSFRQVYVPAIGIVILIAALFSRTSPRWNLGLAAAMVVAMIGSNLSWMGDRAGMIAEWRKVEAMAIAGLEDRPVSSDVIWLGTSKFLFPYSVTYNWRGRQELAAVPPLRSERAPTVGLTADVVVCRADERTLVARSPTPFSIGGQAQMSWPGRMDRIQFEPPDGVALLENGEQDLSVYLARGNASVRTIDVREGEVHGLEFQLQAPISELSFLWVSPNYEIRAFQPPPCSASAR